MFGQAAYKDLDPFAAKAAIEAGALLLDVRGDAEIMQGVIEGAAHLPMHLIPLKAASLPRDRDVVVYCRTGARSAQVCGFLAQHGYDNLHNLAGGIVGWARAGLPVAAPQQVPAL